VGSKLKMLSNGIVSLLVSFRKDFTELDRICEENEKSIKASNERVEKIKNEIQYLLDNVEWLSIPIQPISKKESPPPEKTKSTSDLDAIRASLRK